MRKKLTLYQRIVRAADNGVGVRFSHAECCTLAFDDAIATRAELDDDTQYAAEGTLMNHADMIVIDDVLADDAPQPTYAEALAWYYQTGRDCPNLRRGILAQRWHSHDLMAARHHPHPLSLGTKETEL